MTEYEISIRITFPEAITKILKQEKDRFVAEYGSSYKSDPHITLYLDRYTQEGFPQLLRDLKEVRIKPFTVSLLTPEARREESRHRNLYVVDVSGKEEIRKLHDKVSEIAIRYQSPLLRSKTIQRLEQQGIKTDGTRESIRDSSVAETFDPHITLGEVDVDVPRPDLADVQRNLTELTGKEIPVSSIVVFYYGKESSDEKAKLIEEVTIPFQS